MNFFTALVTSLESYFDVSFAFLFFTKDFVCCYLFYCLIFVIYRYINRYLLVQILLIQHCGLRVVNMIQNSNIPVQNSCETGFLKSGVKVKLQSQKYQSSD